MKFITTTDLRVIKENLHLTDAKIGELIGRTRIQVNIIRFRYKIPKRKRDETIPI